MMTTPIPFDEQVVYWPQGEANTIEGTVTLHGSPVNVLDAEVTVTYTVAWTHTGPSVLHKSIGSGITPKPVGQIVIAIAEEDTVNIPANTEYRFGLWYSSPVDGGPFLIAGGRFIVVATVRPPDDGDGDG
jgi:hypothetical protein